MSEPYQIPGLFLTALCHAVVVYSIAEHRYSRKKFAFYSFIYIVGFVGLMGYGFAAGGMASLSTYMGIVVELFFYSCMVSRDGFPKKSFLFITYFCLFTVLDNMMKLMVEIFLPHISEMAGYYVAVVLRSVVILLLAALYKKYAVDVFRSLMDSGRRWWNLALIALLFYLLQLSLSILNGMNVMPKGYLFLLFGIISFIMFAVYGVVFSNISYMKKDSEAALIRQNAEYLSNQMSVLQNAEETHRRLRHDMRHHMEMIIEYAKSGDTSSILTYAGEYSTEISEAAVKQYSLNRTLNSILSVYADKAKKSGISFLVRCNVPRELKAREIDLIALLGNLLENALHGCQESGEENLSMEAHIRLQSGRLIIVCNNTCPGDLELSGGLPAGKSIGISSVLFVCRKYDGNLDYRIENGVCSVCAVLNM